MYTQAGMGRANLPHRDSGHRARKPAKPGCPPFSPKKHQVNITSRWAHKAQPYTIALKTSNTKTTSPCPRLTRACLALTTADYCYSYSLETGGGGGGGGEGKGSRPRSALPASQNCCRLSGLARAERLFTLSPWTDLVAATSTCRHGRDKALLHTYEETRKQKPRRIRGGDKLGFGQLTPRETFREAPTGVLLAGVIASGGESSCQARRQGRPTRSACGLMEPNGTFQGVDRGDRSPCSWRQSTLFFPLASFSVLARVNCVGEGRGSVASQPFKEECGTCWH